ncbi:MAG: hypothetical protein U5K84_09840 [Alkalibacterium sp.]|nr:hypothetical protein [Alkalibacterium sp.]
MIHESRSGTIPIEKLMKSALFNYKKEKDFPYDRMKKTSLFRKLWNERQLKKLLSRLTDELDPYIPELRAYSESSDEELPAATALAVKSLFVRLFKEVDSRKLLFDQPFLTYFIDQGYMDTAEAFMLRARQEDPNLSNEEVFQALRNVWIMNSLQICWDTTLELTPSMYAYSMLYPYTDNLLDDPNIEDAAKRAFNQRLYQALNGKIVKSDDQTESRIFALVDMINRQYPKETFPEVTESILLIHEAQTLSMKQGQSAPLSTEDVLTISFFKGGTSVLADAYLIKGVLSDDESQFAFEYGAFLQLLDDLQDKDSDEDSHNQTLFSVPRSGESIEHEIRNLISYIYSVNERKRVR